MSAGTLVRRYGLAVYWLAFVLLTLRAGRDPGLVPDPADVYVPLR